MGDGAALVPLLLALPLLGAAVTRLPGIHARRRAPDVVAVLAVGATAAVGAIVTVRSLDGPLVHHLGGWPPSGRLPVGIPLVADTVAAGFVTLASVLVAAAVVHLAAARTHGGGLTHVLTAVLLAAVNGFVLAGDLFTMFVFLELAGITVYAITAGKADDPASLPAAMSMAVTSTVGAVLLLAGTGLLHGHLQTPSLAAIAAATPAPWGSGVGLAVGLVVAGLAVKSGLLPFHFAHADLHTATTIQHAGLFGAVLLPLGVYGIARVHLLVVGADVAGPVGQVLVVGGAVTALVTAVMALCQDHFKRLLAFSSVSHVGITAAGLGLAGPDATAAVVLYVLGHAPVKLGLLLVAGLLLHRTGALQVRALSGRARDLPAATVVLALGGLALAGLPPSGLYAGKAVLAEAAEAADRGALVPVLYLAAVLTGAAVLRVVAHLVTGWPVPDDPIGKVAEAEHRPHERAPRTFLWLPAGLVAAGTLVPLVPGLSAGSAVAAAWFHDPAAYVAAVLEGATAPGRPDVDPVVAWGRRSLVVGVLAGLTAPLGGVAAARWRGRRPPGRLGAPVRALRRLHTAHVGDYTAWLTAGAAAIVGWMVLTGGDGA